MIDAGEHDECESALAGVAAGDLAALERLYRRLRSPIFAVALSILGERAAAEDVVHDTFVRVWERADRYRPGTSARAWMVAVARNMALDRLRSQRRNVPLTERREPSHGGPVPAVSLVEQLMRLDPIEREIVVLHALVGLTHREIGAQLGLPHGTIRWKYSVALTRLRDA